MGKVIIVADADFSSVAVDHESVYVETTETNLVWDSQQKKVTPKTGYAGIYFPCLANKKYTISGGSVASCVTTSVVPVEDTPITNLQGASTWPNTGFEYITLTAGYVLVTCQSSDQQNLVVLQESITA